MDQERACLEEAVSRHRNRLVRLEAEVADVRRKLADAEEELRRLQSEQRDTSAIKATCNAAGKALRQCNRAKQNGAQADELCGKAGRALKACADAKKWKRK